MCAAVQNSNASGALNNSDLPVATKPLFEKVIDAYLTPTVVVFGIIGNCLNLAILGNRKSRSSSAMMLLIGMSSFDLFVLLVQIPHVVFAELTQFNPLSIDISIFQRQYAAYVRYPLTNIGLTGASILSASVAIDRYAAIKNVDRLHKWFKHNTLRFTVSIVIFSVLFNAPKFFDMKPSTELLLEANSGKSNDSTLVYSLSKTPYRPTALASNAWYSNVSYWLSVIVNTLIPQMVMAVFGSIVIVSFAKLRQVNTKASSSSRENRISLATRMVVATICVFFITSFLSVLLIAAACIKGRDALVTDPLLARLRLISNFLAITKSGMNFILYCSTCANYRSALRSFFCTCSGSYQSARSFRMRLLDGSSTRYDNKRQSQSGLVSTVRDYGVIPYTVHASRELQHMGMSETKLADSTCKSAAKYLVASTPE